MALDWTRTGSCRKQIPLTAALSSGPPGLGLGGGAAAELPPPTSTELEQTRVTGRTSFQEMRISSCLIDDDGVHIIIGAQEISLSLRGPQVLYKSGYFLAEHASEFLAR